jgi:hypothetical protein
MSFYTLYQSKQKWLIFHRLTDYFDNAGLSYWALGMTMTMMMLTMMMMMKLGRGGEIL